MLIPTPTDLRLCFYVSSVLNKVTQENYNHTANGPFTDMAAVGKMEWIPFYIVI